MKILGRTFAILAAAFVIVAVAVGFAHSSYAERIRSAMPAHGEFERGHADRPALSGDSAQSGDFRGGSHREGHHGPSLFGIVSLIKNLTIIGITVLLVAIAGRMLWRRQRDVPPGPEPAPPDSSLSG